MEINQHNPTAQFATPVEKEPNYLNKEVYQKKFPAFQYNHPEFDNQDAVSLGPYELNNGNVYIGHWLKGEREGKGKQMFILLFQNVQAVQMVQFLKDIGIIIRLMDLGVQLIQMAMCMKANERMKQNGKGTYYYAQGPKYTGEWLDDKQHGYGEQIFPDGSKYIGNFFQGKKQGKGVLSIMASSIRIQFMEQELITGWMEGNIQVIGKITKCMKKVNLYGQMEGNTLENCLKIKNMEIVWKRNIHQQEGTSREGIWENGQRIKWVDNVEN